LLVFVQFIKPQELKKKKSKNMFTGTSSLSKQGHNSETIKATIELDMCFVVE
jgi:hypothetical protein